MAFVRAGKMEARSMISGFESESIKSRLQEAHVFDNSVSYFGLNGDFTEGTARSCSAALEESESLNEAEEFVFQTRGAGPRGVIFLHYDARDVNTQVDEHFNRSLYAPRIYNVQPGEEFKNSDSKPVPMSQRNFPASFWNPFASNVSPLCCQRAASFIHAPYMPRESSASAGSSAQAKTRIPAPNSSGSSGFRAPRFNPQYNQLLVHPDFRSYLPLVPGQPTGSQEKDQRSEGEDFTA